MTADGRPLTADGETRPCGGISIADSKITRYQKHKSAVGGRPSAVNNSNIGGLPSAAK